MNTTRRGYGARHKAIRAQLTPLVQSGQATCWRCGNKINPTEPWDLGHDDNDRTQYRGPEHANTCNRSAAGRKGAAIINARRTTRPTPDTTRRW